MFLMSHPLNTLNGGGIGGTNYLGSGVSVMDEPNTINPASLNSAPVLPNPFSSAAPLASPRKLKRSRSPDEFIASVGEAGDDGDSKPRKRGRPSKSKSSSSPQATNQTAVQPIPAPVQTPQSQSRPLPQTSPSQASPPPKATPTKQAVIKALPTVRDHTTDQLNTEGDEYIPREFDEEGEKKVASSGHILGGREYRCRTFYVPNRGNKLFMLATECARVLGYRDSYLLFNKNRSLYKIIASQAEKDDLIQQEILLYSYRSRQIAIVTARSMFRQFGSRLIVNGRRVRDDYWEGKARKQGFTEADAAGEKRPGAAKQREAAAAEANNAQAQAALPNSEIIYMNRPGGPLDMQPGVGGLSQATLAPLPMIGLNPTDDLLRQRDYGNVPRPRQEISGAPYQDRSLPSSAPEILNHAAQTTEYNRILGQQRSTRGQYHEEYWKRPQEPQMMPIQRQGTSEVEGVSLLQQHQQQAQQTNQQHQHQPQHPGLQSPHNATSGPGVASVQQHGMMPHQQHGLPQFSLMAPLHSYPPQAQANAPRKGMAQSPVRSSSLQHQQPLRPEQQSSFDRSPSMGLGSGAPHGQALPAVTTAAASAYGYPTTPMWPPPINHHHHQQQHQPSPQQPHQPPPHPSPLPQTHPGLQHQQQHQYGRQQSPLQQQHQQQHQQSPLSAHHQSPLHGGQSTAVVPGGASHLRGQPSSQQVPGSVNPNVSAAAAAMGYPSMPAMPGNMAGLSSPGSVMGGYGAPLGRYPYQTGQSPSQTAMGHHQQHHQHQQHSHHQQPHQQHPGPSMSPAGQHHPQHHSQQQAGGMQGWAAGPGQAGPGGQGPQGGWIGY